MVVEQGEPGAEGAGQDRRALAERLRAASVVAVGMASSSGNRNNIMAASAEHALLDQIDQARARGWSWDDIDTALRHVSPHTPQWADFGYIDRRGETGRR